MLTTRSAARSAVYSARLLAALRIVMLGQRLEVDTPKSASMCLTVLGVLQSARSREPADEFNRDHALKSGISYPYGSIGDHA